MLAGSVVLNSFAYDNIRRMIRSTKYTPSQTAYEHYLYDWSGRIKQKKINTSTLISGAALYQEDYYYTNLSGNAGQQIQKTVLEDVATNPSITTTQTYDVMGRLTEESVGSSSNKYQYDYVGNVIKKTDPLLNVTTYAYDYVGRNLSETRTFPNGAYSAVNTYDHLGNLVKSKDFLGRQTTYQYDKLKMWDGSAERKT